MKDNVDHLNSISCRFCDGKMIVVDVRTSTMDEVKFLRRRKKCTRCGERYSTAEIPFEVAQDVFGEV